MGDLVMRVMMCVVMMMVMVLVMRRCKARTRKQTQRNRDSDELAHDSDPTWVSFQSIPVANPAN